MKTFHRFSLFWGTVVCLWFVASAIGGCRPPSPGVMLDGMSGGRGSGGYYGGGK